MRTWGSLSLCLILAACKPQAPVQPAPPSKPVEAKKPVVLPEERPLLRPEEKKVALIPANARRATIARITDGDTIETRDGEKVRYIGVDTPEREGRDGKPEPFYAEAKEFNRARVEGKEIFLEIDAEPTDKYGRTLAYVWVRDGDREIMVNLELIRAGLAYVYTLPPNVKHAESLLACQKDARENARGFWKEYTLGGEPHYVATPRGRAFHRPSCKDMANRNDLRKFKDQGEALDAGLHPCRNCKP